MLKQVLTLLKLAFLVVMVAFPAWAQSDLYSPDSPIWGIYATGNGYPVFSEALQDRAAIEGISPECFKTLSVTVMPSALVAPDSAATYWLSINMAAGLVETKVSGLTWWETQQALAIYSPYRNTDIDCVGGASGLIPSTFYSPTFGTVSFLSEDRAEYDSDEGRMLFTLSGQVLTGHWVEASSVQTCASEIDGSEHWGVVDITFSADFSSFEGQWDYCDGGSYSYFFGNLVSE